MAITISTSAAVRGHQVRSGDVATYSGDAAIGVASVKYFIRLGTWECVCLSAWELLRQDERTAHYQRNDSLSLVALSSLGEAVVHRDLGGGQMIILKPYPKAWE